MVAKVSSIALPPVRRSPQVDHTRSVIVRRQVGGWSECVEGGVAEAVWVGRGQCGVGEGDDGDTVVCCKNFSGIVEGDGKDDIDN